jgi:hypothetical protein
MTENNALIAVLREELAALRIWQTAKLPNDVREGVEISIDKIERVLKGT